MKQEILDIISNKYSDKVELAKVLIYVEDLIDLAMQLKQRTLYGMVLRVD